MALIVYFGPLPRHDNIKRLKPAILPLTFNATQTDPVVFGLKPDDNILLTIVEFIENEEVRATAALKPIITGPTIQRVAATAATQQVMAAATGQKIIPSATVDGVITLPATQPIVTGPAVKHIAAGAAAY